MIGRKQQVLGWPNDVDNPPVGYLKYLWLEAEYWGAGERNGRYHSNRAKGLLRIASLLIPRVYRHGDDLGWDLIGPRWLTRNLIEEASTWQLFAIGHQPGLGWNIEGPQHD